MQHFTLGIGLAGSWLFGMVSACGQSPARIEIENQSPVAFHALGETLDVKATVLDGDRQKILHPSLRWSAINPAIASVSQTGRVVAVADGQTIIVARAGFAQHQLPIT